MPTNGIEWLKVQKKQSGKLTAADIKEVNGITVTNKDMYITTVDEGFDLSFEIRVEK